MLIRFLSSSLFRVWRLFFGWKFWGEIRLCVEYIFCLLWKASESRCSRGWGVSLRWNWSTWIWGGYWSILQSTQIKLLTKCLKGIFLKGKITFWTCEQHLANISLIRLNSNPQTIPLSPFIIFEELGFDLPLSLQITKTPYFLVSFQFNKQRKITNSKWIIPTFSKIWPINFSIM